MGGNGVEGEIWLTQKFWRSAPYVFWCTFLKLPKLLSLTETLKMIKITCLM